MVEFEISKEAREELAEATKIFQAIEDRVLALEPVAYQAFIGAMTDEYARAKGRTSSEIFARLAEVSSMVAEYYGE